MKILVVAEHDNHALRSATLHAIAAANELSKEIHLLIIGSQCEKLADEASQLPFIKAVYVADHPEYEHQLAENCASLLAKVGKDYDYIIAGASTFSKNLLPRAAALLTIAVIGDVTKILSADTFERPMYAGNILATVKTKDKIKMLTVRTTSFPPLAKENNETKATINKIAEVIPHSSSRFENQSLTQSKRPELTSARVVISGGRGLKSAANFALLETVADQLGAAIGASRAAVDAGFAPNDYQVGQTGKIVAPDLYIAVGISGAIQHLAGMKDSKVIVAINNDPDAPIFEVADYVLVGDLFKILPELSTELAKTFS